MANKIRSKKLFEDNWVEVLNEDDSVIAIRQDENFDPDSPEMAAKFGPKFRTRIIPGVRLPAPNIPNPAKQRLGPDEAKVNQNNATVRKTVVDIPKDELDDTAERDAIKAIYPAMDAGTATEAQVQEVLAYLMKDYGLVPDVEVGR